MRGMDELLSGMLDKDRVESDSSNDHSDVTSKASKRLEER